MKTLKSLVVLAILCLAVAACGNVKESHEMDVKEAQTDLMKYNSVAQGLNKDGQVGWQLTVVGQPKIPSQTITTQQTPVQVTTHPAQPQRPVYNRDTRAAKAVERTPPASPPVTKTEMQTVVTTSTTYPGPEVLATTGGGGPSTGHSVAAAIPGAVAGVASAAVGGAYFQAGMKALRPAKTDVTQIGGGASQTQGQRQGQTTKVDTNVGVATKVDSKNVNINPNTNINDINLKNKAVGTGTGTGTATINP